MSEDRFALGSPTHTRTLLDAYDDSLDTRIYMDQPSLGPLEVSIKHDLVESLHPHFVEVKAARAQTHYVMDTIQEIGSLALSHLGPLKRDLSGVEPSLDWSASEARVNFPTDARLNLYYLPDRSRIIITDDAVIPSGRLPSPPRTG